MSKLQLKHAFFLHCLFFCAYIIPTPLIRSLTVIAIAAAYANTIDSHAWREASRIIKSANKHCAVRRVHE